MDLNNWYGAYQAQAMMIDDWADDAFDHRARLHRRGQSGRLHGNAPYRRGQRATWGQVQLETVVRSGRSGSTQNAGRTAQAYIQTNSFPYETTFLDLDPEVKDPLGDPVIRVTTMNRENERRAIKYAQGKMVEWFKAAGATMATNPDFAPDGPALSTHAYGGTRMGNNPDTSVVDQWGFSHEAPNLGMLGGSVFGTSGARNPTLTIQALAWRTADHLAKNWKAITA